MRVALILVAALSLPLVSCGAEEPWDEPLEGLGDAALHDLVIAPEHRCSPYDRADYPYSQDVELEIIDRQGLVSLYTGREFGSRFEADIEHVVAVSEAHDSGLCAAGMDTRERFAGDVDNLTLAAPGLNRQEKRAKDAGEWLPPLNRCWFAETVVAVKARYGMTVDRREFEALRGVLEGCE